MTTLTIIIIMLDINYIIIIIMSHACLHTQCSRITVVIIILSQFVFCKKVQLSQTQLLH